MFELITQRIAYAGALGWPLLLLGITAPIFCPALYLVGAVLKDKVWALRLGLFNAGLGIGLPLLSWLIGEVRMRSAIRGMGELNPQDLRTIGYAARGEMLTLPWLALLSSPWLVGSGLALLGLALLRHPAIAAAPPKPR